MDAPTRAPRGSVAAVVAILGLLLVAGLVGLSGEDDAVPSDRASRGAPGAPADAGGTAGTTGTPPRPAPARVTPPPTHASNGHIFGDGRFLVAYYGTGGTGALGVLGETDPETMHRRLARAAAPFRRPGHDVQLVYELIVTVADRTPGPDGDFSHDIAPSVVRRYVEAARRHDALLLLDVQPGRARFIDRLGAV